MTAAPYSQLPYTPRPRAVHSEKEDKTPGNIQENKAEDDVYTISGGTDALRGSLGRNERLRTKKGFLMSRSSRRERQVPRKKKTDRVRMKYQGKYRKQKDKQDNSHGSKKLTFSWKKLKKVSQPRSK